MKKLWSLFFILLPAMAVGQIITTFAGGGMSSGVGDGGAATAVSALGAPNGGIFDNDGNFYFVGIVSNRVRKIDCDGIITTVAGNGLGGYTGDGGPATAARIHGPHDPILDNHGNLYIAETQNNVIRKVNLSTGVISTVVGTSVGGFSGDGGPATAAKIWDPQSICFDKFGNLYVADGFNARVRKVDTSGIISTFVGNGTSVYAGDGTLATATGIGAPDGLATDDTGNIYLAAGGKVYKVNVLGIMKTVAGNGMISYSGDGIPATNAAISPMRIRMDSSANLLIADRHNQRVYKVDVSGILHLIAGNGLAGFSGDGGPATAASLSGVAGVAVDRCGNLFITEIDNNRVRKITYSTTCNACPYSLTDKLLTLKENISLSPNPATTSLTISTPNKMKQVSVYNLLGQTIYTPTLQTAPQFQVGIAHLPPGMYMVRIEDEDGVVVVKRFVKE